MHFLAYTELYNTRAENKKKTKIELTDGGVVVKNSCIYIYTYTLSILCTAINGLYNIYVLLPPIHILHDMAGFFFYFPILFQSTKIYFTVLDMICLFHTLVHV